MLIILIVLLLVFEFGGYRMGPGLGYYGGGGISLILVILIILLEGAVLPKASIQNPMHIKLAVNRDGSAARIFAILVASMLLSF